MQTRKDFVKTAAFVRDSLRNLGNNNPPFVIDWVNAYCVSAESDNPRFDSERFIKACLADAASITICDGRLEGYTL